MCPVGTPRIGKLVLPVRQSVTMARMRVQRSVVTLACTVVVGLMLAANLRAQAPASGSIEFQARIQPTGGRLEPVRSLPFYLLRKSVADIHKEAEQAEPPTDLDGFVAVSRGRRRAYLFC